MEVGNGKYPSDVVEADVALAACLAAALAVSARACSNSGYGSSPAARSSRSRTCGRVCAPRRGWEASKRRQHRSVAMARRGGREKGQAGPRHVAPEGGTRAAMTILMAARFFHGRKPDLLVMLALFLLSSFLGLLSVPPRPKAHPRILYSS